MKRFLGKALYLKTILRTCDKFHYEILIACMVSEIENEKTEEVHGDLDSIC